MTARLIPGSAVVGVAVALAAVLGASGCREPCEPVWASETVRSQDGAWLAVVRDEACSAGLGGTIETVVELRSATGESGVIVATPSGQWTGGENVHLTWQDARNLRIVVPNRSIFFSRMSEHRGVRVEVFYQNDDPADRAEWLKARRAREKWSAARGGWPPPSRVAIKRGAAEQGDEADER